MSDFPPVFSGSPAAYSFALFGCMIVTFVSASQILHLLKCRLRIGERTMSTRAGFVLMGFFAAFIIGVAPDILTLLLWSEVSDETMKTLRIIDRVADGLVLVPFLLSVMVLLRIRDGITRMIDNVPTYQQTPYLSPWVHIRRQIGIVVLAGALSAGITIGKASSRGDAVAVSEDSSR